jgi:hypothetical protein
MKKLEKKECFFSILVWFVEFLVHIGVFTLIVSKVGNVKKEHIDPENRYYRVMGIPNLVWFHIQDGHGVFINEQITTRSGKVIDLVKELSKYYWYIDNTACIAKCSELDNRSLARCIGSLIWYGDIKCKLSKNWQVHHKWWRWCNTQEVLAVVCKHHHKHFHDCVNSRKSHRQGVAIYDEKRFERELEIIEFNQNYWKDIPM